MTSAPSGGGGGSPNSSATGQLSANPASVNFGDVTVGTSTAQLVTLTNRGNANVTISTVSAAGSGFSASGGLNAILTPSQSVTVAVNFGPAAVGGATGRLMVSSNASNSPLQIAISGTGVAPAGQRSVTLSWLAGGSPVVGYFVYRGAPSDVTLSRLNSSLNGSTSYTDSSVLVGQQYVYTVRSVNSSNVESVDSNRVTVAIPSP